MKQVIQLDSNGYFIGLVTADESPLEKGVYMMPANTIEAPVSSIPTLQEGKRLKWEGSWVFEDIEVLPEPTYSELRSYEYPSIGDQLDALFHAGVFPAEMAAQIQAVKDKYPKGGAV